LIFFEKCLLQDNCNQDLDKRSEHGNKKDNKGKEG